MTLAQATGAENLRVIIKAYISVVLPKVRHAEDGQRAKIVGVELMRAQLLG